MTTDLLLRTCSIDTCELPVLARGWCRKHYQRWQRHGDPALCLTARGSGRSVGKDGYVWLARPDHPLANAQGWLTEHRMVAYDAGLLTDLSCQVHHRDGNRSNNDLSNLEVLSKADHNREHDVLGRMHRSKTHCPHGHPYDEANTRRDKDGHRHCRTCVRERRARGI